MGNGVISFVLTLAVVSGLMLCVSEAEAGIELTPNASSIERLAAQEIQRYVYLRTGKMTPIGVERQASVRIVVARKDRAIVDEPSIKKAAGALGAEEYLLKTTFVKGTKTWWVIGGDDSGTLYGAYRFAENLGMRFYLHADVAPDNWLLELPDMDESAKPLFSVRGILPFHDFPEGPDWWNTDDYLAYIGQLPKLRMNFIGLHCYPGGLAEPTVWIGLAGDADKRGRVRRSYVSRYATTAREGMWGYATMPTTEFSAGGALLFPGEHYGPAVMDGMFGTPQTPELCNELFNRTADMLRTAFTYARSVGVKTCVGTETPLTVPAQLAEYLREAGKDPADRAVVRDIYEGMFRRIVNSHPLDYYWLWTPEGWTWSSNTDEELESTMADVQSALAALDAVGSPFTLATSGWVLGPQQDRTALSAILPASSPMSAISRNVGHDPLDPMFGAITGRPKWAIPWIENDPGMVLPQPWVGRMRYDAVDARRFGCTGLLGIHWRTKILEQNIAALADAAWDQSWARDTSPEADLEELVVDGATGGSVVRFTELCENTDESPVYQQVCYDVDCYSLVIPDGTYGVTLKFNEPHHTEAGKRVFGVRIQGRQVIDRLDIFERAGRNRALDFTFPGVEVTSGRLNIEFDRIVELPCIAGIAIDGTTGAGQPFTRKINCGGDAYNDYAADEVPEAAHKRFRGMPMEDFYIDHARINFGETAAEEIGKLFAGIDGYSMPQPAGWLHGPGGIIPNPSPWVEVKKLYGFVDELAALRPRVRGAGNLARFDYWLNTYRFMEAMAKVGCLRGELDVKASAIGSEQDAAKKESLVREALDVRISMARAWEQMMSYQLAAVDTPGEMGTVANLEQHTRAVLRFLTEHDELLTGALNVPLPAEANLSSEYTGPARLIVPTVRTKASPGEPLQLRVIVLDSAPPKQAALHWRPLGKGAYEEIKLKHVGRATYHVELPKATGSFEYYITATASDGKKLLWPAAAPKVNQTVVVW